MDEPRHPYIPIPVKDYVDQRFSDHQRQHDAERVALREARDVIDERLKAMNEFRDENKDNTLKYLPREVHEAYREASDNHFRLFDNALANAQGRLTALAGIAILIGVISIVYTLVKSRP